MAKDKNALTFRDLKAEEIEVRVATASEKGVSLLLYKDARCDMNILDETVGAFNWQRSHSRDNANCAVSIWDDQKTQWVSKEDVGTESNTEAVKGLASDSFKRACFNWGIGRELYTAPFIWVGADKCNLIPNKNNGRYQCFDRFTVRAIAIKDKKITGLSIYNEKKKEICYTFGKIEDPRAALKEFIQREGLDEAQIVQACGLSRTSTDKDFRAALEYAKGCAR